MPILEQHEEQVNSVWRRVEVTDEQAKEFQEVYDNEGEWPDWVWDLDWDLENERPEDDEVLSIRVLDEDEV